MNAPSSSFFEPAPPVVAAGAGARVGAGGAAAAVRFLDLVQLKTTY